MITRGQLNNVLDAIRTKKAQHQNEINQLTEQNTILTNQITTLQSQLNEKDTVISAYEDKWNDPDQIQLRLDELGKVEQTTEGTGTAFDPYKYWTEGKEVHTGEWWQTEDGYLWEAKADGVPASSTDANYWDMSE